MEVRTPLFKPTSIMQSSQRKVWHSLAITLSAVGVVAIVLSFATYAVILGRNERRWHGFEVLQSFHIMNYKSIRIGVDSSPFQAILPFGFVLLYLAIASFGINVSPTICALR